MTTRKKKEDPWGTPVNLGPEINSSNNETMADISYDGSMLYFASDQSGEYGVFDIWEVPIIPIVVLLLAFAPCKVVGPLSGSRQ